MITGGGNYPCPLAPLSWTWKPTQLWCEGITGGSSMPNGKLDNGPPAGRSDRSRTNSGAKTLVLIVDDHEMVRVGLRQILAAADDLEVVAEASAGTATREAARTHPDAVVIALLAGRRSGIQAIRSIRSKAPQARVLVLTPMADEDALLASIKAGAAGCFSAEVSSGELIRAVRAIAEGQSLIDPAVTAPVFEQVRRGRRQTKNEKLDMLSAHEQRVLDMVAEGRTNREIAQQLGSTLATVKKSVSSILTKLEVSRRGEAAAYLARRRGRDDGWGGS